MPRQPRVDLARIPQHVVQRGNDRQPCFFEDRDRVRYLQDLREISRLHECALHAYVLMENHVHLLMTPTAPGQVSRVMQALGRRYVRYVNERHHRSGTLWEGRYKACPVADDEHLLRCQRYVELNPVRARIVSDPADYRWSSCRQSALGEPDPLVVPHAAWMALGPETSARRHAWRTLLMERVDDRENHDIRINLQRQHFYGPDRFRHSIEAMLGCQLHPKKIGRPRATPEIHSLSN